MKATYVHNLELDKIELNSTREFWDQIEDGAKADLKRYFRWSRSCGVWRAKAKGKAAHVVQMAERAGFTYAGEEGERPSFEEQLERKAERAGARADRLAAAAERREEESNRAYNHARKMASAIPFGQPILVGHHSEKRDRRYRDRIHKTYEKAFRTGEEARELKWRAGAAARTAAQDELQDPAFLARRIEEHGAELRKVRRFIAQNGASDRLQRAEKELVEKVDYYQGLLDGCGVEFHTKKSLTEMGATHIRYGRSIYPIKRINPKSVTISNWLGVESMTWLVKYPDIEDVFVKS